MFVVAAPQNNQEIGPLKVEEVKVGNNDALRCVYNVAKPMKKSCAHVSAAVTIALFGFSPGMFNVALYCINLTQVIGRVLVAEVEEASGGVTGGDVTWTATEELSPNRTQSVAGGKAVAAVPELGARVVVVALPVGLGRVLPWTATCEALEHVTAGVYVAQGAEARHEMVIPS